MRMTTETDMQHAEPSAADVAALAERLRAILDETPYRALCIRPLKRQTAVQLYRYLSAYVALLQRQEDK